MWKKFGRFVFAAILIISVIGASPAQASPLTAPPIPTNIRFETVVSGLDQPLYMTHAGDGSGRIFILERGGKIKIFKNGALLPTPFLDIGGLLAMVGDEQGLLGIAFAPDYPASGTFYVSYTAKSYAITLARYHVSADPNIANAASRQVLLSVPKTYTNHNGGMLAFGPDGFLYMSTGDGGSGGDPANNGQNRQSLLGKILRLDVSGSGAYKIPASNPYYKNINGYKEEIWAYGLRNAWRFSFDRQTGDLYIGDVGQSRQEEIDFQKNGAVGGRNYGWRIMEGNLCYNPSTCTPPANYFGPILVYNHGTNDSIGCAVTGGYVYRGSLFPELKGAYLYGDFCSGRLWGAARNASNQWVNTLIADTGFLISSFGEDQNGEVYILDYSGKLIHITKSPKKSASFISNGPQDGFVLESTETSGVGGSMNSSGVLAAGDNALKRQYRSVLSFNTSSLPDSAVIVSARIKLTRQTIAGSDPFSTHGSLFMDIRKTFFGAGPALGLDDFAAAASLNAAGSVGKTPVGAVYTGSFKAAALPFVNPLGLTQVRLRFQLDDNNNNIADYVTFFSGDALNAAYRPVLTVTYYIP